MSEITLALEHPSLGCGEIIARYDLSEIQEKAYQQGRADAIDESVDNCIELVKGLISTYDSFESWDDVGVNIVLNELHTLVKDFEQLKSNQED